MCVSMFEMWNSKLELTKQTDPSWLTLFFKKIPMHWFYLSTIISGLKFVKGGKQTKKRKKKYKLQKKRTLKGKYIL